MFIPVNVAVAMLPALSTAIPPTLWRSPSRARVESPSQVTILEAMSEQVKVTATSVLFHPLALGDGDTRPTILGMEVSSTVTTKCSPATFPEASMPVQLTVVAPNGNTEPEGGSHTTTGPGSTESDALFA